MIRLPKNDPWYDDGFSEPYSVESRTPLTDVNTAGALGLSASDLRRFIANVRNDPEAMRQLGRNLPELAEESEPTDTTIYGLRLYKLNDAWRLIVPEHRDGFAIFESQDRAALERLALKLTGNGEKAK